MQLDYETFEDTDGRYADLAVDTVTAFVTRREDETHFWLLQEHIRRDLDGVLSRAYSLMMPKTPKETDIPVEQSISTTDWSPSTPLPQREKLVRDRRHPVPV